MSHKKWRVAAIAAALGLSGFSFSCRPALEVSRGADVEETPASSRSESLPADSGQGLEDQFALAQAAAQGAVSVGSFNLLRLGHGTSKDYERVSRIIDEANFDVLAIVEVMTRDSATKLAQSISARTGEPWKALVSSEPVGEGQYKEYFGFLYREDRVKPQAPSKAYCRTEEAIQVEIQAIACFAKDKYQDGPDFEREPFVGHFEIAKSDYVLVGVHLYYGGGEKELVARRQRELTNLGAVMRKIRETTPSADVLSMGDYNLSLGTREELALEGSAVRTSEIIPESFFATLEVKVATFLGMIKKPTTVGFSNYDHIIWMLSNKSKLVEGTDRVVYDLDIQSPMERTKYKSEVSDHYPVQVLIRPETLKAVVAQK